MAPAHPASPTKARQPARPRPGRGQRPPSPRQNVGFRDLWRLESGATNQPAPAGVVDEPSGLRAVNCALPAHTSARYFLRPRAGRKRDGDAKIRRHRSSPNAVSRRLFDRLGRARSCEPSPGPAKSRHLNAADPPSRPLDGGVDDQHQYPGPAAIGTNAIHDLTGAEGSASTANPAVERQLPGSLEGGPSPGADLPKTPYQGSCWHGARGDEGMRYTAKA